MLDHSKTTRTLFIFSKYPGPGLCSNESWNLPLAFAALNQSVDLLLIDDAVYQLIDMGVQYYSKTKAAFMKSLELYGIDTIYIEQDSLKNKKVAVDSVQIPYLLIVQEDIKSLLRSYGKIFHC